MSTTPAPPEHQEDPDIVRVILDRVSLLVPESQRAQLAEVELQVRAEYGGMRVRVPKRRKYTTKVQREQIIAAALSDPTSTNEELAQKAGLHRATWYRIMKMRSG